MLALGAGLLFMAYLPESQTKELIEAELRDSKKEDDVSKTHSAAREAVLPKGFATRRPAGHGNEHQGRQQHSRPVRRTFLVRLTNMMILILSR